MISYSFLDDRDEDMTVFVETDEIDTAVAALEAVAPRLGLVTFDGHEYGSFEEWQEADLASGGSYETTNANFVFDVERRPTGAYIHLDTKGGVTGAMGRTVADIVAGELSRRGVRRAVLRPVTPSDWS